MTSNDRQSDGRYKIAESESKVNVMGTRALMWTSESHREWKGQREEEDSMESRDRTIERGLR